MQRPIIIMNRPLRWGLFIKQTEDTKPNLIYVVIMSLDAYIVDEDGTFILTDLNISERQTADVLYWAGT